MASWYECSLAEGEHECELLKLQLEESESYRLDLELANDEMQMLQQELYEAEQKSKGLETKIRDLLSKVNNQESKENI